MTSMAVFLPTGPAALPFAAQPIPPKPAAQVLFVVGEAIEDDEGLDAQLADHFGEGFDATVVVDDDLTAADVLATDAVILSPTTSAGQFRPFLLKAAVPVVALKASSWTALGLAPFGADDGTPLQELAAVTPRLVDHPMIEDLDGPVEIFDDGVSAFVGRGWTTATAPENGITVLADGPDGAAIFVYEPGVRLDFPIVDAADVAPACRVGFPGHGGTRYSEAGLALLRAAVDWATGPSCRAEPGQPLTPSIDSAMCRVDPADETRAVIAGELVEIDETGRPNLSSLWVRALAHDADTDVVYVGGRFDRAFDAIDASPEPADAEGDADGDGDGNGDGEGEVDAGHARDGLFACDLTTGTVTDFEVPIAVDSLAVRNNGSLNNDRVRALALHDDHLYVGGRFTLADGVDTGDLPVRGSGVHNLIRVDRMTGEIDTTWTVDVRGGVSALAIHGSHLYVSGGIHTVGADGSMLPTARLARIDLDRGVVDTDFRPMFLPTVAQADGSLFASVSAMEIVGDTLVVGGSFERVIAAPTIDDWATYARTVLAQPAQPWPLDRPIGAARNSVAAFDLAADLPTLTDFAPSLGDNNLAGGDVTAQIRDITDVGDGSVVVCGDWWLTHPEPGLTWIPYDADTWRLEPVEVGDLEAADDNVALQVAAEDDEPAIDEPVDADEPAPEDAGGGADPVDADPMEPELIEDPDPNDPGWEGQRSLHQPRPNQHNIGKFDLATGASATTDEGRVWGATTDGGIQACDFDPTSGLLFIGGHHESIGAYDPDFVDDPEVERYPANHRPLEKVNAIDGVTGAVIEWDPDLDSVRGVDAVLVVPATEDGPSRVIVGGAFTMSDRMPRSGLAMFAIEPTPPELFVEEPPGGLG